MTQLLTDLTSMIAMDLVNELSPAEVQHMKRELGPYWKEQLLTPVMQPITLRSGTVLKLTGGNTASCRAMSRFFARVVLLAFLCVMFMMYVQPHVDPRETAGNKLWMSVQEFASTAWSLTESCPVGTKVNTVIDRVCTLYARFKYAVETGNIVDLKIFADMGKSMSKAANYGFAWFYAFVVKPAAFASAKSLATMEEGLCQWFDIPLAYFTKKPTTQSVLQQVQGFTPEEVEALKNLLNSVAHTYKQRTMTGGRATTKKRSP